MSRLRTTIHLYYDPSKDKKVMVEVRSFMKVLEQHKLIEANHISTVGIKSKKIPNQQNQP